MRQQYLKNVATLQLEPALCTGCGKCLEVCPHGVFSIQARNGRRAEIANRDSCMECGACAKNCPAAAVTVRAGVGCAWAIVMEKLGSRESICGSKSSGNGLACCGSERSLSK